MVGYRLMAEVYHMIVHQRLSGSGGLSCNTQVNTTNFKDPRIKNPGVFCFLQGKMTEIDSKKQREAEWVQTHTLTKQDLRKMIAEKFERATAYYKAQRKREAFKDVV